MKEMTNVATAVMTEEEKAELEKDLRSQGQDGGVATPTVEHNATPAPDPASVPAASSEVHSQPTPEAATSASETPATPSSPPPSQGQHLSNSSSHLSQAPSPSTSPGPNDEKKKKGKQKLSPEQKAKLEELEKERRKAMEERVRMLTEKLIERIRPFVDAERPGDPNDPETIAFQKKIQLEAEDLKLESFGVEVSSGVLFLVPLLMNAAPANDWWRVHD